jgi:flagella synthesis protein FlgN
MSTTNHLLNCLTYELTLATGFIDVLQRENSVLLEPANDQALNDIIQEKNSKAEQLAAAGSQREAALKTLGFANDREGLAACAAAHPQLQHTITQLLETAAKASELNASNGQIIDTFIAHNQQTLETLRNLVGEGTIYDARGRTQTGGTGTRHTIKAG